LRAHVRHHVLAGEHHALQVDVVDAVPAGFGQVFQRRHVFDADVVVQDVDTAMARDAGLDHRLQFGRLADIGLMRERGAALGLDQRHRFLRGRQIAVHAHHPRAFARIQGRRRLAVAPAFADRSGAGDDGHSVLQTFSQD
jgi:hypothetical protein